MLVDDAARGGLESRRQRGGRFSHIVVNQRLQLRRLVPREKRGDQEEQLRLPMVEVAHELREHAHVALLLPDGHRRRMLAGAGQVRAVAWTLNLRQPLGAATNGANLLVERGAAAPRAPCAAQRTNHLRIIV